MRMLEEMSLRFQSTLSVRRATCDYVNAGTTQLFQSTLSVRRATEYNARCVRLLDISIHALREESDFPDE